MQIRSKHEFYHLWEAGVLGNRTLLFHTLRDALSHRPKLDKIGFREIRKAGTAGAGAWELALRDQAWLVCERWTQEGRNFVMDGSVPNDKSTMQGEVCRTIRGLEAFLCVKDRVVLEAMSDYDSVTSFDEITFAEGMITRMKPTSGPYHPFAPGLPPMRVSMSYGWHRHCGYLETRTLLDRYMDPSSRDDLDMLFELYPDATVEFTCFSEDVGLFPNRNTIFWEVRDY